jgi:hypothetical protein
VPGNTLGAAAIQHRRRSPAARKGPKMRYIIAWLLGVPTGLIVLWFLASQVGC